MEMHNLGHESFLCRIPPERADKRGKTGEMMGRFCCVGCYPEWEKARGDDRALDGNATPEGSP